MKCQMLETNIPKSICSKLQIWVSQYFLVRLRTLVPKYGMIYPITTFIPQIVGCIYPYFLKCIFPNPTPERSFQVMSIQHQHIYSTYIYSQNCLQHISNTKIYFEIYTYIPQPCARRAYRNYEYKYICQQIYIPHQHCCPKGAQKLQ